jgi:nuclear pore complex protein Nup98-Nup96
MAAGAAGAAGSAPAASSAVQQQLLLALAASPFGENPLFKTVTETGKRGELLKGEASSSPATGKGLAMSQYKVAPHRNIKVKTKPVDSVNKSSMFDGLDDDLPGEGDMFVPRSSIKKLVLRNKKNADMSSSSVLTNTVGDDPAQETSLTVPLDESRLFVKKVVVPPPVTNDRRLDHDAEESFTALNTRKKNTSSDQYQDGDRSLELRDHLEHTKDTDQQEHQDELSKLPGGISLQRAGYYTIPPLHEIEPDSDGKCLVEGFTIGREGYGNVHYPGTTDITGLNLDEIVFFRHKEVIVYPEEDGAEHNKPELGEGLNKRAQITLDKVWPTDKNDSSLIKSPEKIRSMNFEDKLIRASSRLGAKFIEYRPETGSWVFKVEHFSKYGLDDSDEEEPALDNSKKMKTLHLEKRGGNVLLEGTGNLTAPSIQSLEPRHTISSITLDNQKHIELTESDGGSNLLLKFS